MGEVPLYTAPTHQSRIADWARVEQQQRNRNEGAVVPARAAVEQTRHMQDSQGQFLALAPAGGYHARVVGGVVSVRSVCRLTLESMDQ